MAKKKAGPNKSQSIREYFKTKADAGPTEVVNELKKKGITVSVALVSNVKAAMLGKKPGKKKTAKKRGPGRPAGSGDSVSLSALLEAREFVDKVGGVERAEKILRTLGKLSG